jgi:phenylpropionate dioxygenase-like ring-hydroxylating dioxygenase large terminal subunit
MFINPPELYGHHSALNQGNFVTEDKIVCKDNSGVSLKSRECPHRGYTMHTPGEVVKNIVCKMHGLAWSSDGLPCQEKSYCNHSYKLHDRGSLQVGKSGLLFKNFIEPVHAEWVQVLSEQTDLKFDRILSGKSTGSWLWFMEQLTDVLHLRQGGIHPRQSLETPLSTMDLDVGDGYVTQLYKTPTGGTGYWIYIFPGFAVEFEPGKLLINRVIPDDVNTEFGFTWELQLYYSPSVDSVEREEWEKQIEVFMEDVEAVEKIKRPFFPLRHTMTDLEKLMFHWGEWYLKNLNTAPKKSKKT